MYIYQKNLYFTNVNNSVSSMETTMNWMLSCIFFLVRDIAYEKWPLRLFTPGGTDQPQWLMDYRKGYSFQWTVFLCVEKEWNNKHHPWQMF
jgi:hypothetical protein